jgi:hypothetical protein
VTELLTIDIEDFGQIREDGCATVSTPLFIERLDKRMEEMSRRQRYMLDAWGNTKLPPRNTYRWTREELEKVREEYRKIYIGANNEQHHQD